MTKFLMTAATAIALTTPAWAQADLDANADGEVTLEEVQAVNPDFTAEDFATIDTDGNGTLSAEEVSAAQASGLLAGSETES